MHTERPRPVSLVAEIDALTRLVEKENRKMLSAFVPKIIASANEGNFTQALALAERARQNAMSRRMSRRDIEPHEAVMFHLTVWYWGRALAALKAAEKYRRFSLRRFYLRWHAGLMAEQAYRVRSETREQLFN